MVRLTHFLFIFSWHSSHPLQFQFAFVYVRSSLPTNQRMDKNNASSVQSFHVHANARDAVEGAVSEAPPTRVQLDARTCSCDIREQWSFGRNIRNGSCPHTHLFVFSHSREETKTNSTVDFVCLSWEIVCYWFSRLFFEAWKVSSASSVSALYRMAVATATASHSIQYYSYGEVQCLNCKGRTRDDPTTATVVMSVRSIVRNETFGGDEREVWKACIVYVCCAFVRVVAWFWWTRHTTHTHTQQIVLAAWWTTCIEALDGHNKLVCCGTLLLCTPNFTFFIQTQLTREEYSCQK